MDARRSERATKSRPARRYGNSDDILDSVSQVTKSSSSTRRQQRLMQSELKAAEEIAALEVSVATKELAMMKALWQKRLAVERAAVDVEREGGSALGSSTLWADKGGLLAVRDSVVTVCGGKSLKRAEKPHCQ